MAVAAVLPRVRTIVICDDVTPSPIEENVFTLEGVRQHLVVRSFPWRASLSVFLLLSSPRKGKYPGAVRVVNQRTNKAIRVAEFRASFDEDNRLLPLYVEVSGCIFPEAGWYDFQIYLSTRNGSESLKGEHPFALLADEE
jgi:hypothetical protein